MSSYIVGITGASGSIYAVRLLEELLKLKHEVHLTITTNGKKVLEFELGCSFDDILGKLDNAENALKIHDIDNLFSSIASGSYKTNGMIILPCSMATLGDIAAGTSRNLVGRAADVCIKEKRKLILVPRETPLSQIHLRNMLTLAETGATILPAIPAFYHKPQEISDVVDFIVGKVLDSLGVDNNLYKKWDGTKG